jgi:hypothetical protein
MKRRRRSLAALLRLRNRELRDARKAIKRLEAQPHFALSEMLRIVSALQNPAVRLGHTMQFRKLMKLDPLAPTTRAITMFDITQPMITVTKDIP